MKSLQDAQQCKQERRKTDAVANDAALDEGGVARIVYVPDTSARGDQTEDSKDSEV